MLNKTKRSNFLLVKIFDKKKFKITIPLPLIIIDETLESLDDFVSLFDKPLTGMLRKKHKGHEKHKSSKNLPLSGILNLTMGILDDLRSYGRLKIINVESKDVDVHIELF